MTNKEDNNDEKTIIVFKNNTFDNFAFLLNVSFEENIKFNTTYSINKSLFKIGSSKQNDIILNNKNISETHSIIRFDRNINDFIIESVSEDFKGTFVNNNEIGKNNFQVLKDNDFIRFGNFEMIFKRVW